MNARREALGAGPTLLSTLLSHYDELVDYVRARFGHRGFAHDVVHDVCVRLLERPEPPSVRAPLALLRRISHDAAVDRCRSEDARAAHLAHNAELEDMVCQTPDQARTMDAQRELARLVAAIRAMPLRRRQVFVLYKIHQLPQAEVARRMDISLKMVEKHLRLAMIACRAELERE